VPQPGTSDRPSDTQGLSEGKGTYFTSPVGVAGGGLLGTLPIPFPSHNMVVPGPCQGLAGGEGVTSRWWPGLS
jgi:hypothetical protein